MDKKNFLITGGSGFIGSNFIRLLLSDEQSSFNVRKVINIDKLTYAGDINNNIDYVNNSKYELVVGDICDETLVNNTLKNEQIDIVVNFAAESHVDNSIKRPDEFIKTNINGTFNLLLQSNEIFNEINKNLIFLHVSTDEVYGSLQLNESSFTEKNRFKPNSPYSASKAASDHLVRSWFKTFGLPTLITNCSNNYGPYQNEEKLIPKIIKNAINLETIPVYGDGLNIRDWLYVDDHCKAILQVIKSQKFGETYNIGGLNEIKNIDIVNIICEHIEAKYPINDNIKNKRKLKSYKELIEYVPDRPGHDYRYAIDATKIEKDLGWSPEETFESGIKKTVNWYLNKFLASYSE